MVNRENNNPEATAASVLDKMDKIEARVRQMLQKMEHSEAENLKMKEENQRLRNEILAKTVKIKCTNLFCLILNC